VNRTHDREKTAQQRDPTKTLFVIENCGLKPEKFSRFKPELQEEEEEEEEERYKL
jgi:hypothetical protein